MLLVLLISVTVVFASPIVGFLVGVKNKLSEADLTLLMLLTTVAGGVFSTIFTYSFATGMGYI